MIENPNKNELTELIASESGECVSILMRTHERGRATNQNPIRFKNLISEAIETVSGEKLRGQLEEISKLASDFEFWQHQSAGFALFAGEDFQQRFKLSHAPDEMIYVADHFYTLPIAGAACGGGSTRVLALSWEQARLFACDGHEAHEIVNDSFPITFDALVLERDAEAQLQFSTHSAKAAGPSSPATGSTAMFHGHGNGEDKIEADRNMYLSRIGRLVADAVYNTDHALIVLATEEVAGQFASTTNVEADDVVHSSPDGLDDKDIESQVCKVSHAILCKSSDALLERLGTAIANHAGSRDIEDIVVQAASGRVESLLIGKIDACMGTFDRDKQRVKLDDDANIDLFNLAVRETLQAGGSVVQIDPETTDETIAAIYRY